MIEYNIKITVGNITGEFKGEIDPKYINIPDMSQPDALAKLIRMVDDQVAISEVELSEVITKNFSANNSEAEGTA